MSRLGTNGQWGNQVVQYAFLRTWARRYGIDYEVPPWVGQHLYGFDDPPVSGPKLPDRHEQKHPSTNRGMFAHPILPDRGEFTGFDFTGYAQFHTSYYAQDREFINGLYSTLTPPAAEEYLPLVAKLRARGKTIIGIHLRYGDAGRMVYFLTPMLWVLRWLRENWLCFDAPVLFIATEEVEYAWPFERYNPVLVEDLGYRYAAAPPPLYTYPYDQENGTRRQMNFFGDWLLLQHCDVILGSGSSSYSFSAAWTGTRCREYWWPRMSLLGFEQIDPWDSEMSTMEHLDDYPGIPGVSRDSADRRWQRHWGTYKNKHPSIPEDPEEIKRWMTPPSQS